MREYEVELTQQAEADAEAAYLWIHAQSPEAAVRWWNGLVGAILTLEELPKRCPRAPESDVLQREIRQLLYGRRHQRYRILFVVERQKVIVLHIRHAARRSLGP